MQVRGMINVIPGGIGQHAPEGVEWVRIDRLGGEQPRRGAVWSEAPRVRGGLARWVVPDDSEPDEGPAVLVVTVTKRHRAEGGRGRWFDPGEAYQDQQSTAAARSAAVVRDGWGALGRSAPPWRRWLGCVEPLPTSLYNALSNVGG